MANEKHLDSLNTIQQLAKRRGFIFQSSEIYGGASSCYDFGPLGVNLKRNLKQRWWDSMTKRADIEGLDASILMHPKTWEASGHVDNFSDPMIDCKKCKKRFRSDDVDSKKPCPNCGSQESFTMPRQFNLMFSTHIGPVKEHSTIAYLRPETAQGIFVNFLNIQQTMRKKIPFGIAQIGKAFRNEITPGGFIFRTLEFEQMEMQYFIEPGQQKDHIEKWKNLRMQWHLENGLSKEKLRFHKHDNNHLAHYADVAFDIEYEFPNGFGEIEGIHSRTDFDLKNHQKYSGKSLEYVAQNEGNQKFLPYVIETSAGLDRTILAILCDAYRLESSQDTEQRTVLRLHPKLAPVQVAVLPLMKRAELIDISDKIFNDISKDFYAEHDISGSIGKRYRRQDEIGTPFCLTIDYDSLKDDCVTVRNRDTMSQTRVSFDKVKNYLKGKS